MRLHLIVAVDPENSDVRSAHSDVVREELEAAIESVDFEIDDHVYLVAVLGSGKTAADAQASMGMRRAKR